MYAHIFTITQLLYVGAIGVCIGFMVDGLEASNSSWYLYIIPIIPNILMFYVEYWTLKQKRREIIDDMR